MRAKNPTTATATKQEDRLNLIGKGQEPRTSEIGLEHRLNRSAGQSLNEGTNKNLRVTKQEISLRAHIEKKGRRKKLIKRRAPLSPINVVKLNN